MEYVKLKDFDGGLMSVKKVEGFSYKAWDNENRKMLVSETPAKGHTKRWKLETDRGITEVTQNQMGKILEAAFDGQVAEPTGRTFAVKSNGRPIPDYYFNAVRPEGTDEIPPDDIPQEEMPW